MRGAFGRRILAAVPGAAAVDRDVVDRGAGALGQPQVQRAAHQVELDHHDRTGEAGVGEVEFDRSHPAHQRQPGRHRPLAVPLQRAQPAAQLDPIGRGGDDRARPGQVADQNVELVAHPGRRHLRRALLELADVDQPERDGVVQPPQCPVAVGVGNPQRGGVLDPGHGHSTVPARPADRRACTTLWGHACTPAPDRAHRSRRRTARRVQHFRRQTDQARDAAGSGPGAGEHSRHPGQLRQGRRRHPDHPAQPGCSTVSSPAARMPAACCPGSRATPSSAHVTAAGSPSTAPWCAGRRWRRWRPSR